MTTSSLYATSLVAGTIGTSANALGAPDGVFTTDIDNTNWDARFAMEDIPVGELLTDEDGVFSFLDAGGSEFQLLNVNATYLDSETYDISDTTGPPPVLIVDNADGTWSVFVETQTITVRVRKETGTGTPTLTAELWENGVFVKTLFTNRNITSTTGQDEAATFSASLITNPNDLQIRLIGNSSGGAPSARSTPQIDGITWLAYHITPETFLGRIKTSAGVLKPVKISTGTSKLVKVMTAGGLVTLP